MIPCMGLLTGNPIDGYEYSCDYEHGEILCDDRVCNLGDIDPRTGNRANWKLRREVKLARKRMAILREEYEKEYKRYERIFSKG